MAIETKQITISNEKSRDCGKLFQIKQMSCLHLERWCLRALMAVFGSSGDIPDDVAKAAAQSNAAALMQLGLKALSGLSWERLGPLYEELLGQISYIPNPDKPESIEPLTLRNVEHFVEEASTLVQLRLQALAFSLNFPTDGVNLDSLKDLILRRPDSSTTQTSPA